MKKFLFSLITCLFTVTLFAQTSRPAWLDNPLSYGRQTYENKTASDETEWSYMVGESLFHSSERTARTRAEQDLQKRVASNVAAVMTGNLDAYSFSDFSEDMTEELLLKYEEAINLYVHTKIPRIEYMEYHVETSVEGKKSYKVYVFGRYRIDSAVIDKIIDAAAKKIQKDEHFTIPKEIETLVRSAVYSEKVEFIKRTQDENDEDNQ